MKIKLLMFALIGGIFMSLCVAAEELDGILVKVDNQVITQSDLAETLGIAYLSIRENYPEDKWEEKLKQERSGILDRMIDELVCLRFAREAGINVSDEEVDFQIEALKERASIDSDEAFEAALKQEGLTLEELQENTRRNMIKQRVLSREIYSKVEVTKAAISEYYQENAELFKTPESVKIGLLLLEADSGDSLSRSLAETEIKKIHAILTQGGSFAEQVKLHSQGPAVDNGGDIGYIIRGKGIPEFEDVAFALKNQEISEPFETEFGWNIIKILDYKPSNIKPLTELEDQIRNLLLRQESRAVERDWFEKQRSKTYIKKMMATE